MPESHDFRQIGDSLGDWTIPSEDGVHRRTIVKGAAWTIPVVATAFGAPLAAASNLTPTLEFISDPYTVNGCGTLGPVILHLTTDGSQADSGKTITVSLPDGLVWADTGLATPRPLTTDSNGDVVLSGSNAVKAPANGGPYTISALSATGPSDIASVTVTPSGVAYQVNTTAASSFDYPGVPAGSTVAGHGYFLAPNGDLYYGNTFLDSGVTSVIGWHNQAGQDVANYIKNGVAYQVNTTAASSFDYPGVPAGSTVAGHGYFLAPNGDLYYGNTFLDSGVTSVIGWHNQAGQDVANYIKNGVAYQVNTTAASSFDYPGVPAGSTVAGHGYFLAPNGDLYYANTFLDSGVTSVTGWHNAFGQDVANYIKNGVAYQVNTTAASSFDYPGVPAGSTAAGHGYFLAPNGDLYYANTFLDSGVTSVTGWHNAFGQDVANYIKNAC